MWDRDSNAEHSVIGAALLDAKGIPPMLTLMPDDYTTPGLGLIHRAIAALYAAGKSVDVVSVDAKIGELAADPEQRSAAAQLTVTCGTYVPTSANAAAYVAIVAEKAARRRLYKLGEGLAVAAQRENLTLDRVHNEAQNRLNNLRPSREGEDASAAAIVAAGMEYAARQGAGQSRANLTGIADLDNAMGGLHPGELTILAARPKTGKSTLAWQIADTFARRGQRVMFVSREMPHEQLAVRWFASAGLDAQKIRHGKMTDADWGRLADMMPELAGLPLYAHTRLSTPSEIAAQVDEYKRAGGLGLLVIDYLGLLRSGQRTQNANAEVSALSLAVKRIALEHKIPVLCLAQLNREAERRDSKFPKLSDLRDSGSIEQDADNVIFLMSPADEADAPIMDRGEYHSAKAEGNILTYLEIAKQRQGMCGRYKLLFRPADMRMYSLAHGFMPVGQETAEQVKAVFG